MEDHGRRYGKQMKRGYSQGALPIISVTKAKSIVSVIKRLFGEHIRSRHVMTQNRELSLRCIAYNMHRLTDLVVRMMISTEPLETLMLHLYQFTSYFRIHPNQDLIVLD